MVDWIVVLVQIEKWSIWDTWKQETFVRIGQLHPLSCRLPGCARFAEIFT